MRLVLLLSILASRVLFSQWANDTTRYPWPVPPSNVQKQVGGTFGEYRSTSEDGHFHNATDISASAGTPVYAVLPGTVAVVFDDGNTGYDSYVRINSEVNGQTKMLTYYHTRPVAGLSVGQSIALGQQISTIAIDHVHLIEYRFGTSTNVTQINNLRPGGGLLPYDDPWKPYIRYVKFFRDNTDIQLSASALGGKVDIMVHVEETNGTTSATFNNGTFELGYKILSADGQTVVFNPPDNGLRYRYYNLPSNQYANINYYKPESNTSKHVYIVTNGTGASNVASTQTVSNNHFNVDGLPYGNYQVMVFTYDTRGNGDTVYIPVTTRASDIIAPEAPTLLSIKKDSSIYFTMNWTTPPDSDLAGYRIYYSNDGNAYQLRESESTLLPSLNNRTYSYGLTSPLYLRIHSVDTANPVNESIQSDVYGIRTSGDGRKILIVDGFNRYHNGGSWNRAYHDFVIKYAESGTFSFQSVHNSAVKSGSINLRDYQMVFWMSGDEDGTSVIFDSTEIEAIKSYLDTGGKLFLSGSEIAENLYRNGAGNPSLISFMSDYLKITYIDGDANLNNGIIFDSLNNFRQALIPFGVTSQGAPYIEDAPDVIAGVEGTVEFLRYNATKTGGIYYSGTFGNSATSGKIVFLGFPFESIGSKTLRVQFMTDLLNYFDSPSSTVGEELFIPRDVSLYQNYPNPFNGGTTISFYLPAPGSVTLKVYNTLGEQVFIAAKGYFQPGRHDIPMDLKVNGEITSGIYYARLETLGQSRVVKLVYLK